MAPEAYRTSEEVAQQVGGKLVKLKPYADQGYHTVLLVENDNFATMDLERMQRLVGPALDRPVAGIPDEAWCADTAFPEGIEYLRLFKPPVDDGP